MSKQELAGVAYSYMRFSSRPQEKGDSIRRQTEYRDRWLSRHPKVILDPLTLADLGKSAFHGRHRTDDKTALHHFLQAVESGRVKAGSFLIVESLDRLTREELGDAFELVLGLVNRGVRIVQLSPVESILEKPVNMVSLMLAVVELSRGRGESQRKSDLIGAAWARKKAECRESKKLVTSSAKAWLKIRNGKFVFKDGAKELIRRIFDMAIAGHGCRAISKTLNDEGVKSWTGKPWYEMYIRIMLRGREVLGEYQQAKRLPDNKRQFEGEPILGYYPAAITEAIWLKARQAAEVRDTRGGRPARRGELVNLFAGCIRDAASGDALHVMTRRGVPALIAEGYKRRGVDAVSFPLWAFDRGVLAVLDELDPKEVFDEKGPDEEAELRAKLARIESQLRGLADEFDGEEPIPEVAAKIRAKHAERKDTVERLDAAKRIASSPLSAALGECQGLAERLDQEKDPREARTRLRQALAQIVDSVTALFIPRGGCKIAAVQMRFKKGFTRAFLIVYQQAHAPSNRPARWFVRSAKMPGQPGDLDLRDASDVAKLERVLSAVDPMTLE